MFTKGGQAQGRPGGGGGGGGGGGYQGQGQGKKFNQGKDNWQKGGQGKGGRDKNQAGNPRGPRQTWKYPAENSTVKVVVNYFPLLIDKEKEGIRVHSYSIANEGIKRTMTNKEGKEEDITKPKLVGKKLRNLVALSIRQHFEHFHLATNFSDSLYSTKELYHGGPAKEFEVIPDREPARPGTTSVGPENMFQPPRSHKIILRKQGVTPLREMARFATNDGSSRDYSPPDEATRDKYIKFFNVVLGHRAKDPKNGSFVSVGSKSFAIPAHPQDVGPHLQLYPNCTLLEPLRGYFSSVRPGLEGLYVNVNVCHSAFYPSIKMSQYWENIVQCYPTTRSDEVLKLARFWLIGRKFAVSHVPGKVYTVASIPGIAGEAPDVAKNQILHTFQDYYRTFHQVSVKREYPTVSPARAGMPDFPLEVCTLIEAQRYRQRVPDDLADRMHRFCINKPHVNQGRIERTGYEVTGCDRTSAGSKLFSGPGLTQIDFNLFRQRGFGVQVTRRLETIEAGFLRPCILQYQNRSCAVIREGTNDWNPLKFYQPALLPSDFFWGAVNLTKYNISGNTAVEFKTEIIESLKVFSATANDSWGLLLPENKISGAFTGARNITYRSNPVPKDDDEVIRGMFKDADNLRVSLVIVILDEKSIPVYNHIKYVADTLGYERKIHTVCVVWKRKWENWKARGSKSYFGNVALKINMKLGGKNHTSMFEKAGQGNDKQHWTHILDSGKDKNEHTMALGIDVVHPPPLSAGDQNTVDEKMKEQENKKDEEEDEEEKEKGAQPPSGNSQGKKPQTPLAEKDRAGAEPKLKGASPTPKKAPVRRENPTPSKPEARFPRPSIAAVVGSNSRDFCHWAGSMRSQQRSGQEVVIHSLGDMVKERIRYYFDSQPAAGQEKRMPTRILVFRDGVSEGQYAAVLETELPAIRAAAREVYRELSDDDGAGAGAGLTENPKITLIVVGKRHHTRFYPADPHAQRDVLSGGNFIPGLVVSSAADRSRWDFFLQSHLPLQGTARPAHYVVLHDEIFAKHGDGDGDDDARHRPKAPPTSRDAQRRAQKICMAMCQSYGRANKIVSIPAPVYFADLLCARGEKYRSALLPRDLHLLTRHQVDKLDDALRSTYLENTMFYV
ncbi:Piwi-domain-containing protein [Zalerion maritima]|uniref:Piwi-domain-containing protein n=1 Tax=Zalerion maritima TaxID=339359 RepID=A0AAD5RWI0_9PEZI|nr:Piwi-domain-containing protein [Zalerion maritima]